jgi:two-component system, OmpR family, sensor histidine kinase RstB
LKSSYQAAAHALHKLRSQFDYPVEIITPDRASNEVRKLLVKDEDVMVHVDDEVLVLIPLGNGTEALRLGPVALPQGAIETDMIISLGLVLLLVAISIAFMLRPLARQLSAMERTAISIADGNLSARVDVQRADSARMLARAFNDMASRIEAILRTQRELLQAVSHELRTPLSRINLAIDLIHTARDDEERELRLESLNSAAQELDELVGELLNMCGWKPACLNQHGKQ